MFYVGFIVGAAVALVLAVLVPAVFKWATKQVNDAKTHL